MYTNLLVQFSEMGHNLDSSGGHAVVNSLLTCLIWEGIGRDAWGHCIVVSIG